MLWAVAMLLVVAGFVGIIVPALPGHILIFAGLLLAAWQDGFSRVGMFTIVLLGILTVATFFVDVVTIALGMKRRGAAKAAMIGATIGSVVGIFFGLPGLIVGPFVGAVAGELTTHRDLARAGSAGVTAGIGFLVATVVKIGVAFAMVGIFLTAWFLL